MNIGVFDSGLGGLIILKSIIKKLLDYNYIYLGDTKRVPYGNRSIDTIYEFTEQAVDYLFKQDCQLVILACNTASADALRRIQTEYLPRYYPDQRVLGAIIPTAEELKNMRNLKKVGVIATASTVLSGAFVREIRKIDPEITVIQQAAPLLVPLIENNGHKWIKPVIKGYLQPLLNKKVDAIILGCTHYPVIKNIVRSLAAPIPVLSQDEIIPNRLADYLQRHPEIDKKLTKKLARKFFVTDLTDYYQHLGQKWFGQNIVFNIVEIEKPNC